MVCRRCGAGRLLNPPTRADYWDDPTDLVDRDSLWLSARRDYFRGALRLLGSMTSGRKLLDFGGGLGFFAALAIEEGWDAYSYDVSTDATRRAADALGKGRAANSLADLTTLHFDVITMWCVVAHTSDPLATLRGAVSRLAPAGILWLTTPNFGFHGVSASLRHLAGRPSDFARDDHLFHLTPRALSRLLADSGLCDLRFHHAGTTRACHAAGGRGGLFALGKRIWNATAFALSRLGLPLAASEIQVTCVNCQAVNSARQPTQ